MNKINFTKIATKYENYSLVQKSAADMLIELLAIGKNDDILDLGCGTGYLTRKLRELTCGKVVGVDVSEGMIAEAKKRMSGLDIVFEIKSAEELNYDNSFDVIFCNSSFQWFRNPKLVLKNCYRALRNNGRIGIQAPAKKIYCPNFIQAIKKVEKDPRTAKIFVYFKNPWFFLETSEEYKSLFEQAGFKVLFSKIYTVKTLHTPTEVFKIFESGAAAGYLNQDFYEVPIDKNYIENFRQIVKDNFNEQINNDGMVELIFNRIYLVAIKE
jgi:ubiquinone/menaquinone biosynthesis C-methylase UbiE